MKFGKRIDTSRKSEVLTIGECIEEMLKHYRLNGKFNQTRLINSWQKVMGDPIAHRTDKLFFKNKTLFVKISSAPLKHELSNSKAKIIDLLNKEVNGVVEDIVFL